MYSKLLLVAIYISVKSLVKAEIECPPEGVDYFPDEDCTQYYICSNGEAVPMTCPEDLYFNPDVDSCDFQENVPECIGGTRPPVIGTGTSTVGTTSHASTNPSISTTAGSTTTVEFTSTTGSTSRTTTTTQEPPSGVLTNCGDKMVGNVGLIEYKLNQELDGNERCAFIIRSLNNSGFIFTLEEHGLGEDPLIEGGAINMFSFGHIGQLDHVHLGPPNPLGQVYVPGSVVVIVFRTEVKSGTGFRLRFDGVGNWGFDFKVFQDTIISTNPYSLKYPETGNYQDDMSALFVISNKDKAMAPLNELQIEITNANFDPVCSGCQCDFLLVFSFFENSLVPLERFIAVTQPIKYAKHKSNTRVWLTIVFVWVFSCLVGSPIVLGLNTPPEPIDISSCAFYNYYFVFFSSLCSFYIPCTILVYLYYRIFKVIRERAKKAAGTGHGKSAGGTVIENLAQTKRLAETTLGGPSSLTIPKSQTLEDEKCTNTGSGSQEEGDEDKELDDGEGDDEHDGDGDGSPDSADECQIIANNQVATAFVLESVRNEERGTLGRMEQNGNHDSGYAASNMEEGPHPVPQEPSPASPKLSLLPHEPCKRNGLKEEVDKKSSGGESATSSKKPEASRFTICKAHKASRRKKEKSSAKRERKATKTLAIVLGLFLLCWLPFFTCNTMDAICSMTKQECGPGLTTFLLTTWLGYANSCLNPIIYTIFNQEFRKAFKKILFGGS